MPPCPHCQAQVSPSDAYCISCGARLVPGSSPGSVSGSPSALGPSRLGPPRAALRLGAVVVVNLLLLGGSAYLVHALLERYAAARVGGVSLGMPRVVGSARPAPDAAPPRADAGVPAQGVRTEVKPVRKRPVSTPVSKPAGGRDASPSVAAADAGPARDHGGSGTGAGSASVGSGAGTGSGAEQPDSAEQVRATLDAESVRMVVSHHMPQVRACYDRALKQQETIRGLVEVQFEVSAQGRVSTAKVHRNTTGHVGLGACIANAIKSWRFPRPVGGEVTFIYPFVFSSGD